MKLSSIILVYDFGTCISIIFSQRIINSVESTVKEIIFLKAIIPVDFLVQYLSLEKLDIGIGLEVRSHHLLLFVNNVAYITQREFAIKCPQNREPYPEHASV